MGQIVVYFNPEDYTMNLMDIELAPKDLDSIYILFVGTKVELFNKFAEICFHAFKLGFKFGEDISEITKY